MRAVALWLVTMSACYAPTAPSGLPCSDSGACPSGQTCVVGVCRRPGDSGEDAGVKDAPGDAVPTDAPSIIVDAPPAGGFGTPVKLDALSTPGSDYGVTVSGDGLEILYSTTITSGNDEIFRATRASPNATFGAPTRVAELDGVTTDEFNPELAKNRLGLLFVTNDGSVVKLITASRPTPASMWTAQTEGLVGRVSPTLGASDTRLLITNGAEELEEYQVAAASTDTWLLLRKHGLLQTYRSATMSNDGLEVFVKKDGALYRSVRGNVDASFGAPQRVSFGAPWDGYMLDDPELSADGHTLYLSIQTTDGGATFDLYACTR